MNELAIFNFEGNREVRTLERNGEPWFVAKDVCDVLEIGNPSETLRNFPENEVFNLSTTEVKIAEFDPRTNRGINLINEPGLYRLIFQSRKPEAERFKTWVFTEVLPAIRKKGYYAVPQLQERFDRMEATLNTLLERHPYPMTEDEVKARKQKLMEDRERDLYENNLLHLPYQKPVTQFVCPFYSRSDVITELSGLHDVLKKVGYAAQELHRFILQWEAKKPESNS